MRTLLLATVLATFVLVPRAAHAREWEASAGAARHYLSSPGVDAAATSDAVTFSDLSAGVELPFALPLTEHLFAELRWQTGSTSASDFGLYETALAFDNLELGARAVRTVLPHLRAFAHADVGGARGQLDIRPLGSSGSGISDATWTLCGYAGAGVDLAVYQQAAADPHPDFAFGVRLELGYQVTGAMAFQANVESSSQGAPLATRAAPLGDLDASGAVWQIAVFGRW